MRRRFFGTNILLVSVGIALGLLARSALGPPESENPFPRQYSEPIRFDVEDVDDADSFPDDDLELPSESTEKDSDEAAVWGGVVPPLLLPAGSNAVATGPSWSRIDFSPFEHDERAIFEPHGEQVCASGCALSRHPTRRLTRWRFEELMDRLSTARGEASYRVWDELVYYGAQSRQFLESYPLDRLRGESVSRLRRELARDHVRIQIRVVDQHGAVCSWLPETRIPLDRRHVFDMETDGLQSLVTSGTVKRVGMDHLWVRL